MLNWEQILEAFGFDSADGNVCAVFFFHKEGNRKVVTIVTEPAMPG